MRTPKIRLKTVFCQDCEDWLSPVEVDGRLTDNNWGWCSKHESLNGALWTCRKVITVGNEALKEDSK